MPAFFAADLTKNRRKLQGPRVKELALALVVDEGSEVFE